MQDIGLVIPDYFFKYLVARASRCLSVQGIGNSLMVRSQVNPGQIPMLWSLRLPVERVSSTTVRKDRSRDFSSDLNSCHTVVMGTCIVRPRNLMMRIL